jgi:hypothetical protein
MKSWSDRQTGEIPALGLLRLQLIVAILLGGGGAVLFNPMVGMSLAYGVLTMMGGGWFLRRRIEQAANLTVEDGRRLLYAAAVQRFTGILVLLVMAYAIGLHLLAVAAGIFVAQSAVFLFGMRQAMRDRADQ